MKKMSPLCLDTAANALKACSDHAVPDTGCLACLQTTLGVTFAVRAESSADVIGPYSQGKAIKWLANKYGEKFARMWLKAPRDERPLLADILAEYAENLRAQLANNRAAYTVSEDQRCTAESELAALQRELAQVRAKYESAERVAQFAANALKSSEADAASCREVLRKVIECYAEAISGHPAEFVNADEARRFAEVVAHARAALADPELGRK